MDDCEHCGASVDGPAYECSYCGRAHCSEHRLPEYHDCPRIGEAVSPPSHGELHDGDERIARKSRAARKRREQWYEQREETPYETIDPGTVGTTPDDALGDPSPDVAVDGSIADEDRVERDDADGREWTTVARSVGFWVAVFGGAIGLLAAILWIAALV